MISCMACLYLDDIGAAAQRASAAGVPQPKTIAHERYRGYGTVTVCYKTSRLRSAAMSRRYRKCCSPTSRQVPISCCSRVRSECAGRRDAAVSLVLHELGDQLSEVWRLVRQRSCQSLGGRTGCEVAGSAFSYIEYEAIISRWGTMCRPPMFNFNSWRAHMPILLWLVGVPISIIVLLMLFGVLHI